MRAEARKRDREQQLGRIRDDDVMRRRAPASKVQHLRLPAPEITCFNVGTNRQVPGSVRHRLALRMSCMPARIFSRTVSGNAIVRLGNHLLIPILLLRSRSSDLEDLAEQREKRERERELPFGLRSDRSEAESGNPD